MPIDSSANLLFNIGANSDDAEANIQRFRSLMGKDLDDLAGEFHGWAEKVFGDLTSVGGAMTAAGAGLAAAVVAVAGAAVECANKYEEYVSPVADGTKRTGIAAEQMSVLKYAANASGASYDSLVRGLGFFETAVVKANAGGAAQIEMFQRMGVGTAQLAAGEKNIMPLLEQVMDRFHGLASGVDRAAMARELFSKGGSDLIGFLRLGSGGLRKMADEAERLGLIITTKDIEAMKEHKAAVREMKEEAEAFAVAIGREVLPILELFTVMMIGLVETVKQGGITSGNFLAMFAGNIEIAQKRIDELVHSMSVMGDQTLEPVAKKAKEAAQEFYGLSTILDGLKSKTAANTSEEAKLVQEIAHLQGEIAKAGQEYTKLKTEGKLATDAAKREAQAMIEIPTLMALLAQQTLAKIQEQRKLAIEQSGEDLRQRINAQREHTFQEQIAAWDLEIEKLRIHLEKLGRLKGENVKLLADLEVAGRHRIERERSDAFVQEMVQLQAHMAQIVTAHMTTRERLEFQYDQDLTKYSEVELEKSVKTSGGEQFRAQVEVQFALNRKALLDKYGMDLQSLQNSQGWQGVFGSKFGELLKGNEAAMRAWATSATQSHLMVKYSLEMLDEVGQKTFEHFASGMGGNIASAVVYQKSIGAAMKAALASTLESLAAEALTYGIYATALGFLRLAQYDPAGAEAAFASAAIWGTVGVASAVAGRALTPSQGASSASAPGSQRASGGGVTGAGSAASSAPGGPHVTVNVWGHIWGISGVQEVASALNDAVLNRDVTLTATNTKTGAVVTR